MKRRPDVRPRPESRARPKRVAALPEVPPLPLRHPAMLLVALFAAAGIVVSVSFQIVDTDFWQHLLVGKAIWQLHRVPQEHLWTWANYGTREVLPSWLFRALIWPVWQVGGVPALFAWRWITTLLAFGFAWAAARRMEARGLAPLVIAVWCSLVYRHRSHIRPETMAAVLLAIELWMLEAWRRRRRGGGAMDAGASVAAPVAAAISAAATSRGSSRGWIAGLATVACVWANSHISYFIFFIVLGAHLVDAAWRERGMARPLAIAFAVSLAAAFLNPFGAAALWQPFDYFLRLRHEPMFQGIGELQPLSWLNNQRNGVFVMLGLWPLLALLRIRRRGFDLVEALLCAFFTWYLVQSERFFGSYAVAAAAFFGRDVDEWIRARRWPRWTAPAFARAAIAIVLLCAIGAAEWLRRDRPISISYDATRQPVQAMDFIEHHEVRGRGFSQTHVAGYQLWRFWPDSTRLPFMDIHQTGTPDDRTRYVLALSRRSGWPVLDRAHHFDYVVLDTWLHDSLLTALDADTALALVFLDDSGALYVRRAGRHAALADSFGYSLLGGGSQKIAAAFASAAVDSAAHDALDRELVRLEHSSPLHSRASMLRGTLAYSEQRFDAARTHLEEALRIDPAAPIAHYRLGLIALVGKRPRDAIAEFERERYFGGARAGLDLGLGMAYRDAGDSTRALAHFRREIARWPGSPSASAASDALQGGR